MRRKSYKNQKKQIFKRLSAKNRKCHYCGTSITEQTATVDHKKPLSLGGYNKITNYVLSCARCNSLKGNMDYDGNGKAQ